MLSKCSGKKKLQSLQERLNQTEMAMEKILQQLGAITSEQHQQQLEYQNQQSPTDAQDVSGDGKQAKKAIRNEKYLKDLEKVIVI